MSLFCTVKNASSFFNVHYTSPLNAPRNTLIFEDGKWDNFTIERYLSGITAFLKRFEKEI